MRDNLKECVRKWNESEVTEEKRIDKLLFMDLDVRLDTEDAVYLLEKTLNSRSDLSTNLPFGIPDIGTKTSAFISRWYAAKTNLALAVKGTAFSGQCYMIRNEVAQQIEIPDYIMQEDFYISQRLRKGYLTDYDIRHFYPLPPDFVAEIKKTFATLLQTPRCVAFLGVFSFSAAEQAGDIGHVFAVEPVPFLCESMQESNHMNKFENVTVLPFALESYKGIASFEIDYGDRSSSKLGGKSNALSVPVRTVNKLVLRTESYRR